MQSEMQHRHLEPNTISFSAAMRACEKGEQRQQAQGMLSEMQNGPLEPNVFIFNSAIGACAKGEHWQQALGMLSERQHRELEPDVISFGVAMSSILDRQAQHNCSPSNDTVRTHGSLDFGVLVDVVLELGTA